MIELGAVLLRPNTTAVASLGVSRHSPQVGEPQRVAPQVKRCLPYKIGNFRSCLGVDGC